MTENEMMEKIKTAIRNSETSNYKMATEIGLHPNTIYNIMSGKFPRSLSTFIKLCDYFKFEIAIAEAPHK